MRSTLLRAITQRATLGFLIASGIASGFGIANILGSEMGIATKIAASVTLFLIAVGMCISVTGLHLYSDWQDNGNFSSLIFAFCMSCTTVIGFLSATTAVVATAEQKTQGIIAAEEQYYALLREFKQLTKAKRLREREKMRPAMNEAFSTLHSLRATSDKQIAGIAFFANVAGATGIPRRKVAFFFLLFTAVMIEGGMVKSYMTTRTPGRTPTRTSARTSSPAPPPPPPRRRRKKSRPSPNTIDISSDISNSRKAELLQMVKDEKAAGNRSPFATVAKRVGYTSADALRMMLKRYTEELKAESAVA